MTDPKRFRLGYFDDERCKLYDHPEGEFVTYDDYDALHRLASSEGGGVKVRELEWVERTGVAGTFDASTSIGHYIASITDEGRGHWFIVGQTTSNYTIDDIDVVKAEAYLDYETRIRSALVEVPAVKGEPEPVAWRDGAPPKPWADEWFIAETIYHERVVLRSLPEEYTYDFKTADETYIKAANIKRWMQFPDSEYIAQPADAGMREALAEIKLIALTAGAPGGLATHSALSRIVRLCRDAGITETMTKIKASLTAPGATTKSDGGDRTAPESCPNCFNEDDCASVDICNAVNDVYRPSDPSSTRSEVTALADIAKERQRQREVEGWTPEHDDTHDRGEMLTAAWCYMQRHADADMWGGNAADEINTLPAPARWPWSRAWWKPTNRRRDLVKAGALIVAEIERLDRLDQFEIRRK